MSASDAAAVAAETEPDGVESCTPCASTETDADAATEHSLSTTVATVRWHDLDAEADLTTNTSEASSPDDHAIVLASPVEVTVHVVASPDVVIEAVSERECSRSTLMHEHDVYSSSVTATAASPSTAASLAVSPSASPSASSPSATDWLVALRGEWADSSAVLEAAALAHQDAEVRRSAALRHARTPRTQLSPAVQATAPLRGDVVWKATRTKVTVSEEAEDEHA
jgi:hypothetical protein